jgi:hypothetical protein
MKIRSGTIRTTSLLGLLATLLTACASTSVIVSGASITSNDEAVQRTQQAISSAEARGCKAKSIGSGAGTGVGVGLGRGLVIGENCPECDRLRAEQRELVQKHESIFVIHVLMECPKP